MTREAFRVLPAQGAPLPLVVSIPHTGTEIPAELSAHLEPASRSLPMTDWHLHQLYDFLPALGITVLHAVYSRYVIDLNRAPEPRALYPGRFETGLVPERNFQGDPVWTRAPTGAEIEARRKRFHAPYHERLRELLAELRRPAGAAVLIDAHSVASRASLLHPPLAQEIYLGNRDGASSAPWLMETVRSSFEDYGLRVSCNEPYKGGYITDHYGGLAHVEALQIEMCQRVYMDEDDPASGPKHPRFQAARQVLRAVFAGLIDALAGRLRG